MSWNYRIMKKYDDFAEEYYYSLNEVYYDEDGKPKLYTEHNLVTGSTKDEIVDVLEMMMKDAKKKQPVLTEKDFKNDSV